eukprot:Seg380.5 transcript_id=Seg380.5/GoldUCD/mRNA.D3Y31 product="Histamine N-methyltransferase" protein_id=Seg380.5/GoldUCD/D3Y31
MADMVGYLDHHGEYNEAHKIWRRGHDQQYQIWINNHLIPVLSKGAKLERTDNQLSVLAVGSGNGSFDLVLLEALINLVKNENKSQKIVWTVVELNAAAIEEFKDKVAQRESLKNVEFLWFCTTFQDFMKKLDPCDETDRKYDLITFIHSLYYMNEKQVLEVSYSNILKDGGVILGAKETETSTVQRAYKKFLEKIDPTKIHTSTGSLKILNEIITNHGWKYEMLGTKIKMDITEVFEAQNSVGEMFLKFLLHVNDDPRVIHSKAVDDLLEYLKMQSWQENEQTFIWYDIDIFFIFKD